MHLGAAIQFGLLALTLPSAAHSASWGFGDATLSIQSKGAGVGGGIKEKYVRNLQGILGLDAKAEY